MIRIRCRCIRLALAVMLVSATLGGEVLAQSSADIMHRSHSVEKQDPLMTDFATTLSAGKEGDWQAIAEAIAEIDDRLTGYKAHFGIDLKPVLSKAIDAKSPGKTLKMLAMAIYLGMKEEFKTISDSQMKDYFDSKARLDQAKEYYSKVLSGNVKRKDAPRHQKIEAQFIQAEAALGNPGVNINLPQAPPDPKGFEAAAKGIILELEAVYSYFKS